MLTIKINVQTMNCDYSSKKAVMARFKRSFSEGVGSVISMPGGYIKTQLGSAYTDAEKLRGDWEAVGRELRLATESVGYPHSSGHGKTSKRQE